MSFSKIQSSLFYNFALVVLGFSLLFTSCSSKKSLDGPIPTINSPSQEIIIPAPASLSRLSPVEASGTQTALTLQISGISSGHTVKVFSDSSCSNLLATSGVSTGNSLEVLINLTLGDYIFYAKTFNASGKSSDCSTAYVNYSVVAGNAPSAPSSLALQNPSSSPGTNLTPTIRVYGVGNGFTVKLFTNSTCTGPEVASEIASGETINLTATTLALDQDYRFFARSTNVEGVSSSCSSASVAYRTVLNMPTVFFFPLTSSSGNSSLTYLNFSNANLRGKLFSTEIVPAVIKLGK